MFYLFIRKIKLILKTTVKTLFSNRLIFCILSLAFISLSCGSGAYSPEQNTSQDELTNENTGSIYPHAAGFADPGLHGQYTLANNIQSCGACHGIDFQGGTSSKSCFECHPPYPHGQGWSEPDQHGVSAKENGVDSCAIACHGDNFSGKGAATSCFDCHDPYPHNADWTNMSNSSNHGKYYVDPANTTCTTACHGDNFSGKGAAKSCFDCHRPYPHNADWTDMSSPSNHGRFYVESYVIPPVISDAECASNCHGTDFNGGSTSISCDSCHDEGVFPHVDQGQILWGATGHQNKVNTIGSDAECIICHSDYNKGAFGGALITCTTYCHQ